MIGRLIKETEMQLTSKKVLLIHGNAVNLKENSVDSQHKDPEDYVPFISMI